MNYLRKSDNTCHRLSDIQARLFAKASEEGLPSLSFIRVFTHLEEVRKMDDLSFLFGNLSEQEIFASAKAHLKKRSGGTHFTRFEMHWIGYLYRSMAYLTGVSSKYLYRQVPPKYLREVYPLYHSLDVTQAIDKIFEDRMISLPKDEDRLANIIRDSYQEQ